MTLFLRLGLALAAMVSLAHAADKTLPKETITFDGQKLYLLSEERNPTMLVKEYVPKGQTLDNWTKLAAVFEYPRENDPHAMVERLLQGLRVQNPDARSAAIENSTTGEIIVDFVTWPPSRSFVEFNIFKYSKSPQGGLTAQQYAVREHKDISGFLKRLKDIRAHMIGLMANGDFKVSQ